MKWRSFRLSALWCWHQLLTLALFLLVLVAVVVGVGRQIVPAVSAYRAEIEAKASQVLGVPVRVQALEGAWEGMGPRFHLRGVQVRDPAAPTQVLLTIPTVELRLALLQSLRYAEPRVEVRVFGLSIHVVQGPDGRVQVQELSRLASHDAQAGERALRAVLRQPALALLQSRVRVTLNGQPSFALHQLNVVNRNTGDSHALAGDFVLAGHREKIALRANLVGDPAAWRRSEINLWLHMPVLRLEPWLPYLPALPVHISRAAGGGEYWLRLQNGRLQAVNAKLDWRELVLRYPSASAASQELSVHGVKGVLSWQHTNSRTGEWGWQLAGAALQGRVNGVPWPLPSVALHYQGRPVGEPAVGVGQERVSVAAARANVAGVAQLLPALAPLPAALSAWLKAALPRGELAALRVDLAREAAASGTGLTAQKSPWQAQRADVQMRRFSANSTAQHPGVQRFTGWARWTPRTAWLGVNSQNSVLELPQTFREPVRVQRLQGQLRGQIGAEQWQWRSDHWQFRNADARGTGVFALDIPRADPAAMQLRLLARIEQADAASTWRYVPWQSAGEGTLKWLREGILAGTVRQGDFLFHGPVHIRPDLGPHKLQMRFALENGRLNYAAGWPELRDLNAMVTLDGRHLHVQGQHTRVLAGSEGHHIQASIADLHHPVLQVSAELKSSGADAMQLFRESPLKVPLAGVVSAIDVRGPVRAQLDLQMPLHAKQPPSAALPIVSVKVQLADNQVLVHGAGLAVNQVHGEIRYHTRHGLQASALRAQLLEAPVSASIASQAGREGGLDWVKVNVRGQTTVPALRRWWASPLLSLASGSLPYDATVHIDSRESAPRLQVSSSLVGLRLELPTPLGKTAVEPVPLRYQSTLGDGEQLAKVHYGKRLTAGLVWRDGFLDRALLRLGGTEAAWPAQRGIEVEGRLPRLAVQEWQPWLLRVQGLLTSTTAGRKGEALPALSRVEVEARELVGAGVRLQKARLALRRELGAWRVGVSSDEVQASALWPDNASADIRLNFSRLAWPLPPALPSAPTRKAPLTASPVAGLGSRPWFIDGQGLRLAAWPGLGAIAVKARVVPSPYGLRVDDVVVDNRVLGFAGRIDWQWRGGNHSRVRGTASSTDVAGLLRGAGYAPSLISPKASADIDMSWVGTPDAVDAATLDGRLALTVEQGRLLNVSGGATASRVFGWFDLGNLKRRFKGDFSDVLKRGMAFDKASLQGPVRAGVMSPAVFAVDGPTLKAQGQGTVDVAKQQMDQVFSVTLPVTSAVPLAAIVVAGPLIGGAIAAAQMTFEKQIDKATQLRYRVSGPWSNPTVERISQKKAESVKSESAKIELVKAEPVKTESVKAEPLKGLP